MQQPLLDLDVLGLICEATHDTSTVLSLALVCSALHPMAIQRLLSAVKPVGLKNERTIRTYHACIFADPQSRLPLVRALNISIFEVEQEVRQEVVQCLIELLERATHLDSLILPYPFWTFRCLVDPRIPTAIVRLTTLRELGLLRACNEMQEIVTSTRSVATLRVLRISVDDLVSTQENERRVTSSHLDELLRYLAPTLEVLEITTGFIDYENTPGTRYPAVRTLMAGAQHTWLLRADILIHKFPALDGTLGVGRVYQAGREDLQAQRRMRAFNQERQRRRSWTHLDRVMGDVVTVFGLGLICPVRHLMLDDVCHDTKDQMAEVLRATPLACLKLTTTVYGTGDDPFLEDLFPPEVVPTLTNLVFVLKCTFGGRYLQESAFQPVQWTKLLQKVIGSIRTLHLTCLRLLVHYNFDVTDPFFQSSTEDFVRGIVDLNHAHLAAELMTAMPSLQYVFLSKGGEYSSGPYKKWDRWLAHSAWKRTPSGAPETLDADSAEQMLLDEDLILSKSDEYALGFQIENPWAKDAMVPLPLPEYPELE